jgi:hypothetical protein
MTRYLDQPTRTSTEYYVVRGPMYVISISDYGAWLLHISLLHHHNPGLLLRTYPSKALSQLLPFIPIIKVKTAIHFSNHVTEQ